MPATEVVPPNVMHVSAQAQVHVEDDVHALVVSGIPLLSWHEGDAASRSLAMVLLARGGFAKQSEVAAAFGCDRVTVFRAMKAFEAEGFAGLVPGKSGPRGPRVFGEAVVKRAVALAKQGLGPTVIAHRVGSSEGWVRQCLRKAGFEPRAGVQIELQQTAAKKAEQGDAPPEETAAPAIPQQASPAAPPADANESRPVDDTLAKAEPAAIGQTGAVASDPWDRSADRLFARLGLLSEALPQFGRCDHVLGLGALLAMPALDASGLFEVAAKQYVGPAAAFYGVRSVFACLSLMALLRIKRAERLRHTSPPDLGRLLGLDRAPEVKTLRGRLDLFSAQGCSERFQKELAQRRVKAQSEAMGFLYVDGHVRVYNGDQVTLTKAHVTRMRLSMPATVDHWVNDRDGDPLFVVTATPTGALAKELPAVLEQVRGVLGERRATVVFDRGGWSPKLFAQLIEKGFDLITYRKGSYAKVRRDRFSAHEGAFDGRKVTYLLAERPLKLNYRSGSLVLREVVRLSEDGKHQTSIVTNRKDLTPVEIAYRMFERWRQENFFKYMREEFALDALVSYGKENDDPLRDVPNPVRRQKEKLVKEARLEVARLERAFGEAAANNEEARRPTMRGFKIANAETGKRLLASDRGSSPSSASRVLFLAHRRELVSQAYRKLLEQGLPEDQVGVLMASDPRRRPAAAVQVASIDTLRNRAKPPAELVFVDEAHRACAKSYRRIAAEYPAAVHLGLTATPYRADGQGLKDAYDELVVVASPRELIAQGFLVEPRVFTVPTEALPDLSDVQVKGGDYDEAQLADAVDRQALVGNIVDHWLQHASGLRTVVFAVSIAHSKHIVERFQQAGVAAEHLDGTTPLPERDAILARLEAGTTQVVANCSCLAEGWDQPSVKCAVLARPTKAPGLYLQQAGRILRPWQGVRAVILDHGGCALEHGLPQDDREFSLEGAKKKRLKKALVAPTTKFCPSCFAVLPPATNLCPECGAELPETAVPHETEGQLVEVSAAPTQITVHGVQTVLREALRHGGTLTWEQFERRARP